MAHAIGIDPTVMSAPLITTLVDATGLLIYLSVAGAVLSEI
jgi:magnesium transporter